MVCTYRKTATQGNTANSLPPPLTIAGLLLYTLGGDFVHMIGSWVGQRAHAGVSACAPCVPAQPPISNRFQLFVAVCAFHVSLKQPGHHTPPLTSTQHTPLPHTHTPHSLASCHVRAIFGVARAKRA
jgi:hypothetical protein